MLDFRYWFAILVILVLFGMVLFAGNVPQIIAPKRKTYTKEYVVDQCQKGYDLYSLSRVTSQDSQGLTYGTGIIYGSWSLPVCLTPAFVNELEAEYNK